MRFIAVLISILLLIIGGKLCVTGNTLYDESQVFTAAEKVTYPDFAAERPLVGWYEISGALVDLTEAAYRSPQVEANPDTRASEADYARLRRAAAIYAPAHDAANPESPAAIIVFSRDPDLMAAVKAAADAAPSAAHAVSPRILKGMIRLPSDLPDTIRRALGSSITTQSIILEEYAAPSAPKAIEMMAAGGALILATALMWLVIWKRDRKPLLIPDEYLPDGFDEEDEPALS